MSNPLHDLSRAAHEASAHSPHGHDLYTRPRSSGPPIEMVIVIGMGVLVVVFLLWAMFGSRDVQPASPDAHPLRPAAAAAPAQPAPAVVQESKQPPSPWAGQFSAAGAGAEPAELPRKQWTIPDAIQVSVKIDPDGSVYFVAVNRSPYTVIDLQVGSLGDDHIVAMPAIPPGRTIQKKIDDSEVIKAVRAGTLPPPAIWAGDFQP